MSVIETYRGTVPRWEVDHNDHLTVAYYLARVADAGLVFLESLDLGALYTARSGRVCRTVDCYLRYREELRVGDLMHVTSGVIRVEGDTLVLGHTLFNSETGAVCTTVEHHVQQVDRATERPVAFSAAQRAAAGARVVTWDGPPRERRPLPATLDGFRDTARDTVKPSDVDALGGTALSSYVHRFSAANGHAVAAFGMTPGYQRGERRGFSTFEFQMTFGAPLEPGTPVVVKSALVHVGTSSLLVVHVMLDERTGARAATLHQFGVHFDADARRPAPLPDALRDKALAALVPVAR